MRYLGAMRAGALAVAISLTPAAAQAESVRAALAAAYSNNPNIISALLQVKSTAEGIVQAKAGKLPSIGASIEAGAGFSAPSAGDFSTSRSLRVGASYRQRLFDNLRTEADIEQARALTELSRYNLRNAEQNVLLSAAQAYFNVIRDTEFVQLRAENMTFYDAQLTSAQDRLRLGEGTKLDVSQAQTRQVAAVSLYRSSIASLQTSQASYVRWIGHKPTNLSPEFNFGKALPTSIDNAIASADANHPALLSARASIRVAQAGADAASAAFGPTLDLIGTICGVGCFGDPTAGGLTGSVNLTLTIPFYAGGALGAGVRKANLQQIQSEVDALSARDQIRESVIAAWATLQNSISQIQSAEQAVASSQLAVEGTIQERDVGQKTTLDVLNARAELTTAREALIDARTTRSIASFALLSAAGRLSAEDLRLGVQVHSADGYIATVEDVWQELRAIEQ